MAVIRQRQQVFSKPIGVTRMDTGEADLWKTVKAGADQLTSIAFREGQTIAEETGREAALDLDISKINGVNPETGMSEPLSAPQGFGSIARRAYEKVVDARFMDDAQDRLKLKAKELGSKYSRNPEEFSKQMSSFIAETADKTAEGKYRSTIIESGQKFLSDMQINLIDQQRSRARARETDFANFRAFQYGERIGEIAASGDFEGASKEAAKGFGDAKRIETAGMNGRKETEIHRQNHASSFSKGAVEHILNNLTNDVERRSFLLYLETKGEQGRLLGYAKRREVDINTYLVGKDSFLDANNMRDVIAYGTGLGSAATQLDNAKIARLQAESAKYWKSQTVEEDLATLGRIDNMGYQVSGSLFQVFSNIESDPIALRQGISTEAQTYNAIQGVARLTNDKLSEETARATERRRSDPNYTNPEYIADIEQFRRRALDSFVLLGISEGNSDKFLNALNVGRNDGISETQVAVVEAIRTNPNLFDRYKDVDYVATFIKRNKDTVREEIAQRNLAWQAGSLGDKAIERTADIGWEDAYSELKKAGVDLGIVKGAYSYPAYQDQLNKFNTAWAKSRVNYAMSQNITPAELNALELYVRDDVRPAGLTDLVEEIYGQIDQITGKSLDRGAITNHIRSLKNDLVDNLKDIKEKKFVETNIVTGVQPDEPAQSKKVSDGLDSMIAGEVFNIEGLSKGEATPLIRQALLNPDSLAPPTPLTEEQLIHGAIHSSKDSEATLAGAMVYETAKSGVISSALVSVLKDVASVGPTTPEQERETIVAMNHFSNLSTSINSMGDKVNILSNFEKEIGEDVMARLTAVDLVSKIVGTDQIPSILARMLDNKSNKDFQQIMKAEFGEGYSFLTDKLGTENYSIEAKEALTATANYLYLISGDVDTVADQLKELYDQKFHETKGLVVDSAQTKQNRSMFAVHQVFPQERVQAAFINEVQTQLSKVIHPDLKTGYTLGSGSGGGAKPTGVLGEAVGLVAPFALQRFNVASGGVTFEAGEAFLHPLPKSNDRAVYYMAMEMDKLGGMKPIKLNGELMIFSNQEPYLQEVRREIKQDQSEANRLIQERLQEKLAKEKAQSEQVKADLQNILRRIDSGEGQ